MQLISALAKALIDKLRPGHPLAPAEVTRAAVERTKTVIGELEAADARGDGGTWADPADPTRAGRAWQPASLRD
ncbi:MAG: hypothetical protein EOO22_14535 [Comamonadaceae bacterium]|nr:MAG: hypothetical protein EOO22_14535 [Comamonadaceae bacterium]